jgi:hypothetical protein
MKPTTAYACMWFATVIGVVAGIYFTKNANCLWTFIIPACVQVKW